MKKIDFKNFNAADVIAFAWEKRVMLIIISVAAAIISIIASFQITPLFKSEVVVFPAPNISISKSLLSDNYTSRAGVLNFGEEEQADQLLQVLYSDQIRDRIINKYDLMNHYEIDSKFPMTTLHKKYNKYVTFKRTEYQSVLIKVMDKEPETAANIANDICNLIDSTMNRIQRDRAMQALKVVENEYFELANQIKEMEDSLNVLRSLGIHDYESQSEVINDAYAIALSERNMAGAKLLEEKLKVLAKYGGAYVSIRDFLEYEKKHLSDVKAKYVEAKVEAEQNIPQKFVVNNAYPSEKKSYPKKSIIVIVSTMAAFLFGLVVLIIMDNTSLGETKK